MFSPQFSRAWRSLDYFRPTWDKSKRLVTLMKLCLFIYKGLYCQEMSRVWHLQERTCEVLSAWRMPVADSLQLQHLSQFYIFPRQLPSQWLSMVEAQAATISAQRGLLLRQATLLHSPLGCSRLQIICTVIWDIFCPIFLLPLSFHRIKSAWHSEGFPCPVLPPLSPLYLS